MTLNPRKGHQALRRGRVPAAGCDYFRSPLVGGPARFGFPAFHIF
jgi:hypothetical protein